MFYLYSDNVGTQGLKIQDATELDAAPRFHLPYGNKDLYLVQSGGNVGIGTATPQAKLHIEGGAISSSTGDKSSLLSLYSGIGGINSSFLNVYSYRNAAGSNWLTASTRIQQRIDATDMGFVEFNPVGMPWGLALGTANQNRLYIDNNGQIGIGTTRINDNAYQLFVEKGIRTRKVKVDQTTWADYVFEPTYKLPSLKEVEAFIKQYKHLPDVPSQKEVEEKGLDLGDNQAILLKKIEEQMLYIIELNKEVKNLRQEIDQLKKK